MLSNKIFLMFFALLLSPLQLMPQTITLRDTTNQYDYIIITVPEFVSACEPFKTHKETVRDFRTLIVDTTQIFAEFDSSLTPQDNIRNFVSYAGTFWREPKPIYFLLLGNVQAVPNFMIPSPIGPYYDSDYYYKYSTYSSDTTNIDFYVGRIPTININEAQNYFSKVIEYESDPNLHSWLNNNLFIYEQEHGFGFLDFAQFISDSMLPDFIRPTFITQDSGSIYYGNKDSIHKAVNETGHSIVWFTGHGGISYFISTEYFNLEDISGFQNGPKYFLTVFMGGQSSIIDSNTNFTKELLVMENAGSLGGGLFTGLAFWGTGKVYNILLAGRLFNSEFQSLGEVYDINLLNHGSAGYYMQRIANLWADPSLILKYDPTVGVEEIDNEMPTEYVLYQNYPNPFNPRTNIGFRIADRGFVSIKVYDVLGKEIATLVNEEKPAGNYEVEFDATNLTSGIYFYQLKAGNLIETKKMLLLK